MSSDPAANLHDSIAPYLPMLRRFARALTGSQFSGDRFTVATLEAILADSSAFSGDLPARVALYRTFCSIWVDTESSMGADVAPLGGMEDAANARLARLDPRARQAVLLGTLEEFTTGEIATIMSVTNDEAQILFDSGLEQMRAQTRSRIMIIEDEAIIAMDLQSIVTDLGHECVGIADTRDTAVALAADERPSLILSDIQLADDSSGIDAVRDILPELPVPVIFITAFPERLLTGARPEPTFLITKPFKRAAVEAAISQALFFNSAAAIEDLPS